MPIFTRLEIRALVELLNEKERKLIENLATREDETYDVNDFKVINSLICHENPVIKNLMTKILAPVETKAAPASEVEAAPASEVEAASASEVEAVPASKVEAAPAPEVEAASASEVEAASLTYAEATRRGSQSPPGENVAGGAGGPVVSASTITDDQFLIAFINALVMNLDIKGVVEVDFRTVFLALILYAVTFAKPEFVSRKKLEDIKKFGIFGVMDKEEFLRQFRRDLGNQEATPFELLQHIIKMELTDAEKNELFFISINLLAMHSYKDCHSISKGEDCQRGKFVCPFRHDTTPNEELTGGMQIFVNIAHSDARLLSLFKQALGSAVVSNSDLFLRFFKVAITGCFAGIGPSRGITYENCSPTRMNDFKYQRRCIDTKVDTSKVCGATLGFPSCYWQDCPTTDAELDRISKHANVSSFLKNGRLYVEKLLHYKNQEPAEPTHHQVDTASNE